MECTANIMMLGFSRTPPAIHLCPAGNARLDVLPNGIGGYYLPEPQLEIKPMWSWPYDRHISLKNIDELRQFIEAVLADKLSNLCDPLIIF